MPSSVALSLRAPVCEAGPAPTAHRALWLVERGRWRVAATAGSWRKGSFQPHFLKLGPPGQDRRPPEGFSGTGRGPGSTAPQRPQSPGGGIGRHSGPRGLRGLLSSQVQKPGSQQKREARCPPVERESRLPQPLRGPALRSCSLHSHSQPPTPRLAGDPTGLLPHTPMLGHPGQLTCPL